MPWECNTCKTTIDQDDVACPGCQSPKTSWTLVADATRTFVVSSRKLELLRSGVVATEAVAVRRSDAAKGLTPDHILTVRLHPRGFEDLTITLGVGFVGKMFEELTFPSARPAGLPSSGHVDVPFLFVFGPGDDPTPDGVHVVDIGETSETGFAPELEFTALKKRPRALPVIGAPEQRKADLLEVEDAHFHSGSAVLLPSFEGEVDRVTGIGVLAAALDHLEENPGLKLLITGHTDTTGAQAGNVSLSQERAESVRAALVGDREAWVRVADAHDKPRDHQAILAWADRTFGWGCDPGPIDGHAGPKTRAGVEAFQAAYNRERDASISVDGLVGPQTLGAVFDLYEEELGDQLGVDAPGLTETRQRLAWVDPATVGCGEHHPIDNAKQDDYRSAQNRRVELLFFAPGEEPALACHSGGGCDPAACPIYDWVQYRTEAIPVEPDDWDPDPQSYVLRALLLGGYELRDPIADTLVEVKGPLGQESVSFTATTDALGLVESPSTVPVGVYRVAAGSQVGRAAAVPSSNEFYTVWMSSPEPAAIHDNEDMTDQDLGLDLDEDEEEVA